MKCPACNGYGLTLGNYPCRDCAGTGTIPPTSGGVSASGDSSRSARLVRLDTEAAELQRQRRAGPASVDDCE